MAAPEAFALKEFFSGSEASAASLNLSPSFAQPLDMAELLALDTQARSPFGDLTMVYPPLFGHPDLRQAIIKDYPGLSCDQVIVTAGLDDAIANISLALVEKGDQVIVQAPAYQPHGSLALWRGAAVVSWPAQESAGWQPDLNHLADLLKRPTRLVMVCFPHNPTGFMPDEAYLQSLIELVEASGSLLIADEIYAGLPADHLWPKPMACRSERAVSLHGLSKTRGLPGARIGWMASQNADFLSQVKALRMHLNSYNSSLSEALAIHALRHDNEILARNTQILRDNLALAGRFFGQRGNFFEWRAPDAGVNAYPRWLGPDSSGNFSQRLLREADLLLAASSHFDHGNDHFRVGLGCRDFPQALERLDHFLSKL